MLDGYGREINYLRISVTSRCNLRCIYCVPEGDSPALSENRQLSIAEICRIARIATNMGIRKIKLTGGEPLLRVGIVELVAMLSEINGIRDLSMSTNGILLSGLAKSLADAGLQRVNISLDTLNPNRYSQLTGGGNLSDVLAGIEAARKAGLKPIKLNCVVKNSSTEPDAQQVAKFAAQNGFEIRFIRRMNLRSGEFWVVEGGSGGDCKTCNRIRLTADGLIRPCLFNDISFSIDELGIDSAIREAISAKPESGTFNRSCAFLSIGG